MPEQQDPYRGDSAAELLQKAKDEKAPEVTQVNLFRQQVERKN